MRRALNFLVNKWVLSFIGVTALAILIWFGADYIKFGADNHTLSGATRLILILLLFFLWIVWRLVSWGLEKRQNNQLLDSIEQAQAEAAANPDEQRTAEELSQISGRFRDALAVLRQSRFKAAGNSKALYQLPWYIIIGPPGSGKTTALVNSGLDFPLANSLGKEALGGVGGTRNCDWWFTNEAVLIDTAGRYTTQDSHRVVDNAAWHGFLELLKKYRRRRPINGAIVAISLQDLMLQTAEQRQYHAKTIRGRIDELQNRLGINFPIYLMFTKCDLVAGFSEFFANLSQAEREQVWGTTFPLGAPGSAAPLEQFAQRYDEMIARLNRRLLWRIHNERSLEARCTMQGFPNRMDSLRDTIGDFLQQTFSLNKYNVAPMLRGVYFTSGTQEGTPIDRMMASVSANFGLPREVSPQQKNLGKSFFIGRLLRDVIFPESELVGVNRRLETFMLWGRRASFAAIGALSVGAVVVWAGSLTRNKLYMREVNAFANQYREARATLRADDPNPLNTLPALDPLLQGSKVYNREEHPWLSGLGLYDADVDEAAKALYREKLGEHFLPSYVKSIERTLSRLSAGDSELLDTLRTYLMLHDESRRDLNAIKEWSVAEWQQQFPGQADKQKQLLTHLNNLFAHPLPPLERDERLVQQAQRELRRLPVSQRLYAQMKRNTAGTVDLYGRIGGDAETVFEIPSGGNAYIAAYLFTKEGFENQDYGPDSPLLTRLADDQWLYGTDAGDYYSEADKQQFSNEIERAYLNDYSLHWQNFLLNFRIAGFNELQAALTSLKRLSDRTYSPLVSVLEVVSDNTRLRPPIDAEALDQAGKSTRLGSAVGGAAASAVRDAAASARKPTSVDNEFRELQRMVSAVRNRPAPIQEVLTDINSLHEMLSEIATSGDPDKAAFNASKARFASGGNDAIKQLRRKALNAPQPLKSWLEDIADNSWRLLLKHSKRHINRVWDTDVASAWRQRLAGRYPFGRAADSDVSLADFKRFFSPGGVEQNFENDYLEPFVDTRRWQPRTLENASLALDQGAINQLRRAQRIRRIFFAGGDTASIELVFQQRKLYDNFEEFSFDLGTPKKDLEFRHGPPIPKSTRWNMGEHDRARILVKYLGEDVNADVKASFSGEWAWLRLLDTARIQSDSNNSSLASFTIDGNISEFKLTAKTAGGPFSPDLLGRYQNPGSL